MLYENIKMEEVVKVQNKIDANSETINSIVQSIIRPYVKDLDNYVEFISSILKNGENPPTAQELDDFCMNLSTYIYFASGMCEQLGIKDDIAKAVYKETYNNKRNEVDKGTVSDKDSIAELASQQEQLTSICFTRSYKIVKAKIEAAQEMLASVKKIINRRTVEMELTRLGGKV